MARQSHLDEDEAVSRPRTLMVRGSTGMVEDDYSAGDGEPVDSPLLDLKTDEDSAFLRSPKRVRVRSGPLPKKAANRLKFVFTALCLVGIVLLAIAGIAGYCRNSWRFRIDSSDQIKISGNRNVARAKVLDVFGADISRNIFLIPLDERKQQLERIPWVESASVMRLLPNRLGVELQERTPVAYVQFGARIGNNPVAGVSSVTSANKLIDAAGVIMDAPPGANYSFPVILGFNGAEPLSLRAARMKIYQSLVHALDSGGANYSRDINETDLSDPEDVRITVSDQQGEVLLHLGRSDFLERYRLYVTHVQEWRQLAARLDSVDLRYDGQVVVNQSPVASR